MDTKIKMIEIEKSPCIVLQYDWKLTKLKRDTILLSNKLKYQENDSFRVGLKYPSHAILPTLFFLTTNLNKLALKATGVNFYTSWSHGNSYKIIEMDKKTVNEQNGAIQLFTAPVECGALKSSDESIAGCFFHFTVYLNGIIKNYQVNQIDSLLRPQLWPINSQQHGTDHELIAKDGKRFPVHKWILAARSRMFVFDEESSHRNMDGYTADEINHFIKFIYTGEWEGPVSSNFNGLASVYEVETLDTLCKEASQEFSEDEMASIALHLNPGDHKLCNVENSKPSDFDVAIKEEENVVIINATWKVDKWTNEEKKGTLKSNFAVSEAFEKNYIKLFRAELEASTTSDDPFTLRFLSYNHQKISCNIEKVTCSITPNEQVESSFIERMDESPTHDKNLLQLFTVRVHRHVLFSLPFSITFHLKVCGVVTNFSNKLVDSTLSQQLWAAARYRKMTDVEFLVGKVDVDFMSFGAHRSLLSARSPVFAAMFASGMQEAETGEVRIEDVHPLTFCSFLYFLYTGLFEHSDADSELFKVTDKYQVETLIELCRSATQLVDMEDVLKTFLSC